MTTVIEAPAKSLRSQLLDLERAARTAKTAWKEAEAEARQAAIGGSGVVEDLADYLRDVQFKRRGADPFHEADLTAALLGEAVERGLRIVPLDLHRPDAGVRFIDSEPGRRAADLKTRATVALQELVDFRRAHSAELEAEERAEQMSHYRAAVAGNDPAALAAALRELPTDPAPRNVMTTDDLPESRPAKPKVAPPEDDPAKLADTLAELAQTTGGDVPVAA
jgi:hypothetical protein